MTDEKQRIIDDLITIRKLCIDIDNVIGCQKRLGTSDSYDEGCKGCIIENACEGFNPILVQEDVEIMLEALGAKW